MKKIIYFAFALIVSCTKQTTNECNFPDLNGPYLGQEIPGDSANVFAPGIVSSGMPDRDIAIYPDGSEIYFCRNIGNFKFATIFFTKIIDGKWTKPEVVSFATNPNYIFIEPHISPDGTKFLFASSMQAEGSEPGDMEIWVANREGDTWGKPYNIGAPINTITDQYFPSVTDDGTIYYTSEDTLTNEEFLYRSKFTDGEYQKPEKLPENVNMGRARFNAFVSPNEDYIIVPSFGMPDSYGATDYYIVFRDENDNWSQPVNMGETVNSANGREWSASLSPDGKFIFFMSAKSPDNTELVNDLNSKSFYELNNNAQNGYSDIYWVKADFINDLRKQAVFK